MKSAEIPPRMTRIPPLGSHMSIAGGVDCAPERGASVSCTAMQIFVKNNNRWDGPPITDLQARRFATELDRAGIAVQNVFAHTCYLINLASTKREVVDKSVAALADELRRCQQLALPGLVMHPGAHLGEGSEKGIAQVAELTLEVFEKTPEVKTRLLYETTAGTGSNLGAEFGELGALLRRVNRPDRTGICLDTCHIFAAGHDIREESCYKKTMKEFDREVGLQNLHAVHLNDSKHPLGSRKDRHEHIGKGHIGEKAFELLLRDRRFTRIPMSLETEKGEDLAEDRMNLKTLYRLAGVEYPP